MEMTYCDVDQYVKFYSEHEREKIEFITNTFAAFNAQSTAVSISSALNKNGSNILKRYIQQLCENKNEDGEYDSQGVIDEQFDDVFGVIDGK